MRIQKKHKYLVGGILLGILGIGGLFGAQIKGWFAQIGGMVSSMAPGNGTTNGSAV